MVAAATHMQNPDPNEAVELIDHPLTQGLVFAGLGYGGPGTPVYPDWSGRWQHGTFQPSFAAGPTWEWDEGLNRWRIDCSGTNYSSFTSTDGLTFGPGVSKTISLWHYDPTGPILGSTALVAKDGMTAREWALFFGNRQITFLTFDAGGTPTGLTQSDPIQYTAGRWNHFLVGYDAGTRKSFLRINAGPLNESGVQNDVVAGSQSLTVGASEFYASNPQRIAYPLIFNRLLSTAEQALLMDPTFHLVRRLRRAGALFAAARAAFVVPGVRSRIAGGERRVRVSGEDYTRVRVAGGDPRTRIAAPPT